MSPCSAWRARARRTRRTPLALVITALFCTLPPRSTRAAELAQDYVQDDAGRRVRVRFDPSSRVWLGGVVAAIPGATRGAVVAGLEGSIDYERRSESGPRGERVRWQLDHRVLTTTIYPGVGPLLAPMDATLYRGTYLRHAERAYLTFPSSPPRRVPFPFDIGLDVALGSLWVPAGPDETVRIGAARTGVVLDPWRSGVVGRSLELALVARYDLDWAPGVPGAKLVHRIAPLTSPQARLRWQDDAGLTRISMQAAWIPQWSSAGAFRADAAEAHGRVERVLVAVNDQPLALALSADYWRFPGSSSASAASELRVGLGLGLGFQLR